MQTFWKKYSVLLVYIAAGLLAFSDTGWYFYANDYLNSYPAAIIFRRIALALLFTKAAGTRYTRKQFTVIFVFAVLSLYNYVRCQNTTFLYSIALIAALKDTDLSRLFKIVFCVTTLSLLLWGVLSVFGIGDVISITMDFGRGGVETRYCWGMHHPNIWHFAFARCIVYFVLGFEKHLKWHGYAALAALNYLAYYFTISRTGFLATTIFLLIMFSYKYLGKLMNTLLIKLAIPGAMIGVYGAFLYFFTDYITTHSPLSSFVNTKLTTGRLGFAADYLTQYPAKLWGRPFQYGTVMVFDCGFLRLFCDSGYLLAGMFFAAFFLLLFLALKNNWYSVVAACVFIALYSIYELDPTTRPTFNIVIFFMAILLYQNNFKDYAKKNDTSQ